MVWAWLQNIARKRGRYKLQYQYQGSVASRFLLISCCVFVVIRATYRTPDRPCSYEYLISNLAGCGAKPSCPCLRPCVVSYPDPDSQQLRMDYITAKWKVGLAHRSNFLVLWILECYAIFVSSHKWSVVLSRHILIIVSS